jgi:hypothetical protein
MQNTNQVIDYGHVFRTAVADMDFQEIIRRKHAAGEPIIYIASQNETIEAKLALDRICNFEHGQVAK